MGRLPASLSDYIKVGGEKGLEFIGGAVPRSVKEKTQWRCIYCGKEHFKTYRAVLYGEYGCTCQNNVVKKPEEYYALAEELGISWVGEQYSSTRPANTKAPTYWEARNGTVVVASYAQLAYGEGNKEAKRLLGLVGD